KSHRELNRAVLIGGVFIFAITFGAYVVGSLSNVYFFQTTGQTAVQAAGGNLDKVIPAFIAAAMPLWFTYLFMVALLSAAMSTLSAQFHVQGTAFGRDIYETLVRKTGGSSVRMARIGIVIAVLIAVIMGFILPSSIVALGTSLWFGITAAAFLAIYVAAIYWKRATKEGAIAGLVSGAAVSLFWLLFGFKKTAEPLGVSKALMGQSTIITSVPWPTVDPMIVALPVAVVATIVVSLLTKPPEKEFIDKCFQGVDRFKGK
ncbi:MAG: sodium:solute symporter, partial [Methanobacteriales archaeon HGW-Methanobacteriales-2]